MNLIKESCVETYDEAMNAEIRGADRIELCSRLDLDGLTPSKELVKRLVSDLTIPLKVMVRPRKGDFCYSNEEINQMHDDILYFKSSFKITRALFIFICIIIFNFIYFFN